MGTALETYLAQHIRTQGPVDIGTFMALALGHPQYGYYMKQDPFGADGDFTTAPEISQMFGEVIGAWVADIWMQMGKPGFFTLLECGPGRGTLMADMMRATQTVEGFHAACGIHLLEMSPALKVLQEQNLDQYDVRWHETLETLSDEGPLIVLGNEFLDALPVRQLVKSDKGWHERVVAHDDAQGFYFGARAAGPELTALVPEDIRNINGVFEISPARAQFVRNLAAALKACGGVALFLDYGHARPAPGDTLQALYKHEYVPVLSNIGNADLTAHVDFGVLREISAQEGLDCCGPVAQGAFLEKLGINARAQFLMKGAREEQKGDIQSALHRLTHGEQMGALFKVIGLSAREGIAPAGF
jgi:NADH dehydrogenase [ubiquinone] 1 alpha subcomplex assembly factor 7